MTKKKPRKLSEEEKARAWEVAADCVRVSPVPMTLSTFIDANIIPAMRKRAANIRRRGERG